MIDTLYLSYKDFNWNTLDLSSKRFLDHKNWKEILSNDASLGDFYSSLEDMQIKHRDLAWLIERCRDVILIDVDQEKLLTNVSVESIPLYGCLLTLLKRSKKDCSLIRDKKLYQQLPWNMPTPIRPCTGPVLWVGGCSISAGHGVTQTDRYAHLISLMLNMPTVVLAESGSSISRQFDRWISADIKPNDIVVWGLTNISRVDVLIKNQWEKIPVSKYDRLPKKYRYWDLDFFNSPTQSIASIKQVLQFETYCKKIGLNEYYLINLADDTWFPLILENHDRFLDLGPTIKENYRYDYADFGDDNAHPGPKQHAIYANQIVDFIKSKNENSCSQ